MEQNADDYLLAVLDLNLPDLVSGCLDGADRMKKIVAGLKNFTRKDDGVQKLADFNRCIEDAITVNWNEIKYKATIESTFGKLSPTLCF